MKYKVWVLPIFTDARGELCPIEFSHIPFTPQRIYFLHHIKNLRGAHAHLREKEMFVCMRGSFRATIYDGKRRRRFKMNKVGKALYTANLIWHEFDHFTSDAIMLVISSTSFEGKKGYIIDFEEFLCKVRSS